MDQPLENLPLRVGLLLDSLVQPQWVARMLDEVASVPSVQFSLIILNDRRSGASELRWSSPLRKAITNRDRLAFELFSRLDRWLYATGPDPFLPTSIEKHTRGVPIVRIQPRMTKFCDYFEDSDVDQIVEYNLDVALRLGFRILKGRALQIANYGIWSYHHGDNLRYRGGPPGFWEVVEGTPTTGSILQILTESLDDGVVLHRSYFQTSQLSVWRNRSNLYWKSLPVMAKKLRELSERGPEMLRADPEDREFRPYSNRLYVNPRNSEVLAPALKLFGRQLKYRLQLASTIDQWILAYRFHGKESGSSAVPVASFHNLSAIIPPKDRYWADPFPVLQKGAYFLFAEEYLYNQKKGRICLIEPQRDGSWQRKGVVLERDYHLSYPFMFQWRGEHFMIPETSGNRTIELYRCVSFPGEWELAAVLLENLSAVDATLAQIGEDWWMFANVATDASLDRLDTLHLYHARGPFGPWRPHRQNPVKIDVRSTRPAGRLFQFNDQWYRPAQDCSESYGAAISINKVLRVGSDEYREVEVGKISPNWMPNLQGTHTINAAPGLTIVDGLLRRRRYQ